MSTDGQYVPFDSNPTLNYPEIHRETKRAEAEEAAIKLNKQRGHYLPAAECYSHAQATPNKSSSYNNKFDVANSIDHSTPQGKPFPNPNCAPSSDQEIIGIQLLRKIAEDYNSLRNTSEHSTKLLTEQLKATRLELEKVREQYNVLETNHEKLIEENKIIPRLETENESLIKENNALHKVHQEFSETMEQEKESLISANKSLEEKFDKQLEIATLKKEEQLKTLTTENQFLKNQLEEMKKKISHLEFGKEGFIKKLNESTMFNIDIGPTILDYSSLSSSFTLNELFQTKHPEILRFYTQEDEIKITKASDDLKQKSKQIDEFDKKNKSIRKVLEETETQLEKYKTENEDLKQGKIFKSKIKLLEDDLEKTVETLNETCENMALAKAETEKWKMKIRDIQGDAAERIKYDRYQLMKLGITEDLFKTYGIDEVEILDKISLENIVKRTMVLLNIPFNELNTKISRIAVFLRYEKPLLRKFVTELHMATFGTSADLIYKANRATKQFNTTGDLTHIDHPLNRCLDKLLNQLI
ncbi:Cnm67p NDAI_0F03790 [Naumovozyma dairenensis CBS 421]|uniref:Uncharacterized protein n=1 Tax=Naumovozyma dairenensis (strain ATCC 10597 / BCRC 20456 / CBS 421 / NBRC 0211 / NRRL Y-12639) TaxID=1071378 RepID=G0WD36_NAUDC|nr:hypothetical protein NDAI_0F03790 [Naumovozyma dairenensis CBS 421]CCD25697.1 hypothetical protein NDAI_0F03790 [Naumovozyma dairenensis CBS 421]